MIKMVNNANIQSLLIEHQSIDHEEDKEEGEGRKWGS